MTSFERISGPRYDVGTRWRETRKMFGTEASEEMEVVAIEQQGNDYPVKAQGVLCHAVTGWEDTADYLERLLAGA